MQNSSPVPASDLENARRIRKMRSFIKAELKKGNKRLEEILSDKKIYKEYVSGMKLLEIIKALPGYGKISSAKLIEKLNINRCKTVKGLGVNQYARFIDFFNIQARVND